MMHIYLLFMTDRPADSSLDIDRSHYLTRLIKNFTQVASLMPVSTLLEGEADVEVEVDQVLE